MNRVLSLASVLALLLLAELAMAQVNATLGVNPTRLQGTHLDGSLLLYAPDPVQTGSSISHWDTSATPNLLMEPFATDDLPFLGLDITPAQMQDVFWATGTMNVNIFDLDPPGTGFTDPTPFAGAPGNPASTLGEARINLFNAVLGAWANVLDSDVDVDVLVSWQDLYCQEGVGAVLAGAGTTAIISLEDGGLPGPTWFHAALAESLIGGDLTGLPEDGGGDIIVFMNSALDNECLGAGTSWYYGLDAMAPAGQFGAASTLLHELGHGLGFSNFIDETTGSQPGGFPGVFDLNTFDNTTGKFWYQMNDAERVKSAVNSGQVTWEGALANAEAQGILEPGVPELVVNSPPGIAGAYNITPATFGGAIPDGGLTGELVCMKDALADRSLLNGCSAATNPGELAGKIALIDRGDCSFATKVANAQAAGASAAIIANNIGRGTFAMSGFDPAVTIPAAMVGREDGNLLRAEACRIKAVPSVTGTKEVWSDDTPYGQALYRIILSNSSFADQPDNPGDEFVDVLPPGLALVSAYSIDGGTVDVDVNSNTVTWNGEIPANRSVTIFIDALIIAVKTTEISNQGLIYFDGDGDGNNETETVTHDPSAPGSFSPTIIQVVVKAVPTLPNVGLIMLALLLAGMALLVLRSRRMV